ncbi:MAG TPA: MarR family transcriptional regulator [Phycisphaerales bacterium]|nr:MarR family transcriptional regulator [Phycisphaerales bacterium]
MSQRHTNARTRAPTTPEPTPPVGACFAGCLATSARMLDRALTAFYDEALRPLGVRSTQAALLATIDAMGAPSPSELVPVLHIDQTTLSRGVERLAQQGLLRVEGDEGDARRRRITLTRAGTRVLRDALPVWQHCQRAARAALGADLAERLAVAAARVAAAPAGASN